MTQQKIDAGELPLARALGPRAVVLSGIGVILGAGIYALIGEAASSAGNALWLTFILAAAIAAFTGLSYAELSSMFPLASAEYEYVTRSFGHRLAFIVGIMVILSGIVGAATVAFGFAGYFEVLVPLPLSVTAALLLLLLSVILYAGIRQSAAFVILFTLIEVAGLLGIIAIGFPSLGSVDYLEMPSGLTGVLQAAALIFFAYQGFEEIVKLSEETREPEKTIPRGLLLAIMVTIVLYVLVAISSVSVGGWEALAGSPAPFTDIARRALGNEASLVFTVIALFATANTALLMLLSSSRIMYGMARSGSLPAALGRVHQKNRTPWVATAGALGLSLLFLLLGSLRSIALVANFTLYITFVVINAAVIALRLRMPDHPRPFRIPGRISRIPLIPVFGILTCLLFMFQLEAGILLIGAGLILAAAIIDLALQTSRKRANP